jgi:hypothetical protein
MTRQLDHVDALCVLLEAKLAAAPPVTARRLLRPQLRWVAATLGGEGGDELAQRLGVVALVEACRDEHLASLDADDGLAALSVDWRDVVVRACARAAREGERRTCRRCGAPLRRKRAERCGRCGLAAPIHTNRSGLS